MKKCHISDKFQIQCYKHNGKVHCSWDEAIVLDIKKEYIVLGNYNTTVIKAEGNSWKTKGPAIMYFFKDEWFNIIAQLKKDGIYYKCNIATPYLIEEQTIKYIDYDLDLRIFPSGDYKILDQMEYLYHKRVMNYSDDLDFVINQAMKRLIDLYDKKVLMFDEKVNNNYYEKYKEIKKQV
ncbi:MAG: DUF402 domain-containing protein [Bacilli bacterium]